MRQALNLLRVTRAISIPILTDEFRKALLTAAQQYPMRSARESVGTGVNRVDQDMLLQDQLKTDDSLGELVVDFQHLFDEATEAHPLFPSPVIFNDVMLQKYAPGSGGITPHRDRTDYRHLVCLFVLNGLGRFYIADDRQRTNAVEIANLPGDVLLMQAPGFAGQIARPFHFLENITRERWIFGLRHDQSKLH